MPRDLPDWGALSSQSTVYEVTDLGELAVRLGSPISHDRRGDVVWWDDFECGLTKWTMTVLGTGAAIALSTVRARNGSTSVKLTGGSDVAGTATIEHQQSIPVLSNFGIEASFQLASTIKQLRLLVSIYDGTTLTEYTLLWSDVDNELSYLDSDGNFITFATGVDLIIGATLFHTLKLVLDAVNKNYIRIILDNVEYTLSDIGASPSNSAVRPMMRVLITNYSRAGGNDAVYIDDVIITQNEPAT